MNSYDICKDSVRELVLYTINTNNSRLEYEDRLRAGRVTDPWRASFEFRRIAMNGAREYSREFGSGNAVIFNAATILAAAAELAEYYANHAAECSTAA
jgi:hypothetical protein